MPELFDKPHPFKEQLITVTIRMNTDETSEYLYKIEHIFEDESTTIVSNDQECIELAINKINFAIRKIIHDMDTDADGKKALKKQIKENIMGDYKEENPI